MFSQLLKIIFSDQGKCREANANRENWNIALNISLFCKQKLCFQILSSWQIPFRSTLHFKTNSKYILIYTCIETIKAFCSLRCSIVYVAQRGGGVSNLGSSQATWTWSWATCLRWHSLSWARGQMNGLQRALSTSAIQWFCKFRGFSIQCILVGMCICVLLKLKANVEMFKQSRF